MDFLGKNKQDLSPNLHIGICITVTYRHRLNSLLTVLTVGLMAEVGARRPRSEGARSLDLDLSTPPKTALVKRGRITGKPRSPNGLRNLPSFEKGVWRFHFSH